jgi:hypothetical protein
MSPAPARIRPPGSGRTPCGRTHRAPQDAQRPRVLVAELLVLVEEGPDPTWIASASGAPLLMRRDPVVTLSICRLNRAGVRASSSACDSICSSVIIRSRSIAIDGQSPRDGSSKSSAFHNFHSDSHDIGPAACNRRCIRARRCGSMTFSVSERMSGFTSRAPDPSRPSFWRVRDYGPRLRPPILASSCSANCESAPAYTFARRRDLQSSPTLQ